MRELFVVLSLLVAACGGDSPAADPAPPPAPTGPIFIHPQGSFTSGSASVRFKGQFRDGEFEFVKDFIELPDGHQITSRNHWTEGRLARVWRREKRPVVDPAGGTGTVDTTELEIEFDPAGEATKIVFERNGEAAAPAEDLAISVYRHAEELADRTWGARTDLDPPVSTAFFNEPFWTLRVTPRRMLLTQLGAEEMTLPPAEPAADGESRTWATVDAEGRELQLTLSPGPCSDSMSGARFEYVARLAYDGHELAGCATDGFDPPGEPTGGS